jgi:hypothetical protein
MATTKDVLRNWFEQGKSNPNITHMIIKWDSFDGEDYLVYVTKDQNAHLVDQKNVEKTMECYSMSLPIEDQLNEHRAFHWD